MKKSKISILLLLIVMILAISAVSAADTDDTSDSVVQAVDEAPIEEVASEDVGALAATDDADVLADVGDKNFTQLQAEIDESATGMITLQSNYVRAEGESDIEITKNFNFFGNDIYTIDAKNLGGIFKINSGCSVLLSNVVLTNANGINGGAIYNEGTVNVISSTLTANKASLGGAIYNTGIATISGSTLTGNTADKGGAVYSTGTLVVDGTNFNENVATYRGGAVYNEGNFEATDSTFDRNDITFRSLNQDNGGAAVYNLGGTTNLDTVRVTNNIKDIVYREGNAGDFINAAITSTGRLYIDSSYIANNSGSYGGGVYVTGDETFTVSNTVFENNVATFGAAIYDEGAPLIVENCNFTANHCEGVGSPGTANTQAAAILVMKPTSSAIITGSRFNRNSAKVGGAISISNAGDALIDKCEFVENTGYSEGGAIYNYAADGATLTIQNSTFTDNVAPFGSAISNDADLSLSGNTITGASAAPIGNYYGTIESEIFVKILEGQTVVTILPTNEITAYITDDNGNAIIDRNLVLLIEGNEVETAYNKTTGAHIATYTFTNPGSYEVTAKDYDAAHTTAAIIIFKSPLSSLQALIDANTNGTLDLTYGFSYLENHDSAIKDTGVVISKDITLNGNGVTIDGANVSRLFTVADGVTLTLNNMIITNGSAEKGAGVYVNSGAELLADSVNFINNTAVKRGGAIYSEGKVLVDDCLFESNDITFRTANEDNGGAAIYNLNGVLNIYRSNITNNLKDIVIREGNNGDLLVGVVVTSSDTFIIDSYFANNTGSWGGAISSLGYMNTNPYTLYVMDTTFEGNNATFGGAIFVESSNLKVDNCTFENNKGVGVGSSGTSNTQGGAIVVFPTGASADIADSTFIGNSANMGGAVSFAGVDGDTTVDNCTFINNAANDGGAVYLWTQGGAAVTVENSEFEGNTADWGSAISTDGDLYLKNNTIVGTGVGIGNYNGKIISYINATFLGNQTVPAELGETFTLNATLTDDNGNVIRDYNFRFSVNGVTIDDILFDETTGLYTVDYTIKTAGPKVVSTNYELDGMEKFTGILDVPKANVTEFYVGTGTLIKIPYGENVTVFVGLRGVNAEGLNETVKVVVNNTEYTVTLVDGKGSFNVSGLAPGEYGAFAIFDGDDNYNGAYANGFFNVLYPTPILKVVTQNITYGEDAILNISLTEADGTALQGTLTISVNDFVTMLDWTGENSISVPNLAANETGWMVLVSYAGDNLHSNVYNDTEIIKVAKATPTIDLIGPFDINITEDAEFTVHIDAKADVYVLSIWIDGTLYEAGAPEWDSNKAAFLIPASMLNEARDYNITVQYIGNDNYTASGNVSQILTVNKLNISNIIQIDGSTVTYGENGTLTFEFPLDAEGTVSVVFDGIDGIFTAEVAGGVAIVEVPGLNVGTYYPIDANYSGDAKYAKWTPEAPLPTIEVKQASSSVMIISIIGNETYPGEVDVAYLVQNATIIKIVVYDHTLSNAIYNQTIVATDKVVQGYFTLKNLAAGNYLVDIENNESQNYAVSMDFKTFEIGKAVPTFTSNASEGAVFGDNVTITVKAPEDATGMVFLSVDGELKGNLTLENGVAVFNVTGLGAGHHSYDVSYEGDANYTDALDSNTFEIAKANVTITITVNETQIGVMGSPDVNITVSGNATGNIEIINNGIISVEELQDGKYNYTITDLAAGEYTIEVIYLGDNNYNKANETKKFTVAKSAATPVISDVTDSILGGQNATFKVNMDSNFATGNVTIFVDGAEYTVVVLDDNYANATVVVSGLENGTHTIGVRYNGNDNYNASDIINTTVTVTKAASKVTIDPIDDVVLGHPATIKFTVENETQLLINVTDANGNAVEFVVNAGIISIAGEKLAIGTYNVTIVNRENSYYTESKANATFNVVEDTTVSINITTPENSTDTVFSIKVPADAGGYLLVDVDGKNYYATVENGTANVTVPGLAPGNYTAQITYTGDGKYPKDVVSKEFTVPSNLPEDALTIPETADTESPLTYSINLPADATGYLIVDVDGTKYVAPLVNGSASITVPALSEGNHNVTVTYTGDGKYSSASKSSTLSVKKPVYKITQNKNVVAIYSAKATYKVLITKDGKAVGAGEKVTIKYNGKTYTVKTDSKGYATLKLNTKVKVKKYTITAEYKGVKVTNKVTIKHVIKAKNKKVKKSKKVTKVKIALKKVNGKVLKAKKLKIKFNKKTYKVKTNKKGVAVWKVKKSMLKRHTVGKKYKYIVTYGKDKVSKKLIVKR